MSTTNLASPVEDMTCTSCMAHVERALQSVEGVDELKVKLDVCSRTETVVLAVQWGWVGTA
ncbi:MAG: heavy-metal-associated domain-containing protein [Anaerolineae bacterium]